jgi:hypothetical protein
VGVTQTVFTCDPVSGKYLVIHRDGGFYEYDVVSDAWRNLPGRANTLFSNIYGTSFATVAAPVSTYGVIMFLAWNFNNSKVLLYKHDAPPVAAEGNIASRQEPALSVFPNPFNNEVQIRNDKSRPLDVKIYNIAGKLVADLSASNPGLVTWNADKNPAGIYLLRVKTGNKYLTHKLIHKK